jgi:hypothetical protein
MAPPVFVRRQFDDLRSLLNFVADAYDVEDCRTLRLDRKADGAPAPRYLFRGENSAYDATIPSERRFVVSIAPTYVGEVTPRLGELYNEVSWQIESPDSMLNGFPGAQPMNGQDERTIRKTALALLQHYGLPSPGVDFSQNPAVAAAFATDRPYGDTGLFAVLDIEKAQSLHVTLHDGAHEYRAWRLMRQEAWWACPHPEGPDLKNFAYADAIHWYAFRHGPSPLPADYMDYLLYDGEDRFNQFLKMTMDRMPPLTQRASRWFADRLGSVINVGDLLAEGFFPNGYDPQIAKLWNDPRWRERGARARAENAARWAQPNNS